MTFIKNQPAWNKDSKMSEETKDKISKSLKGRIAWNKGKTWSNEVKEKISQSKKRSTSMECRAKNG